MLAPGAACTLTDVKERNKRWSWPLVAALLLAAMAWLWKMALDDPPRFGGPPAGEARDAGALQAGPGGDAAVR